MTRTSSRPDEFTKGLLRKNPVFVLLLGLCPTLAVTTRVTNALGMGASATFVLIGSNLIVSVAARFIPRQVRIPCYVVVIATFVTVVKMVLASFFPDLNENLGIFIPLIVVNCIVLGRAEAFAAKNGVVASLADGLGMGLGFTLSLTVLSAFREVIGSGTFTVPLSGTSLSVFGSGFEPFSFMVEAPGAFVCLGLMLCVMNMLGKK